MFTLTDSSFRVRAVSGDAVEERLLLEGHREAVNDAKVAIDERVLAELPVAISVDERSRMHFAGGGIDIQRDVEAAALHPHALDGCAVNRRLAEGRDDCTGIAARTNQRH